MSTIINDFARVCLRMCVCDSEYVCTGVFLCVCVYYGAFVWVEV
jgi:hypothetical protein